MVRRDVGTGCLGVYGKQEAGQEQRFDHLIIIQCKYPHGIIIRYLAATKFIINECGLNFIVGCPWFAI